MIVKKYVKSYGNLYEYGKNYTNWWNYWDILWYVLQFWEKFKTYMYSIIVWKKSMVSFGNCKFYNSSAKLLWFNQNDGWKLL